MLGIDFGAQIIAQALGGQVEKLPMKMMIGKEVIELAPSFFKLPYVQETLEPYTSALEDDEFAKFQAHLLEQVSLTSH